MKIELDQVPRFQSDFDRVPIARLAAAQVEV